jgi:ligand-binding sensor domain-containing protein
VALGESGTDALALSTHDRTLPLVNAAATHATSEGRAVRQGRSVAVVLERRGVEYFKDRQLRASYGVADGLGKGQVPGIQLDEDGALWGATEGGISRIKDGHIDTLTSQNGLLCDTIHWTMRDDSGALWAYAACGLFRIGRTELETWIAQPTRRIETSFWDAADGVHLRMAPGSYGPFTARSVDGKLWFLGAESPGF